MTDPTKVPKHLPGCATLSLGAGVSLQTGKGTPCTCGTPEQKLREILMAKAPEENYHDAEGRPISLDRLARDEPEWAANRIRDLQAQLAARTAILTEYPDGHKDECRFGTRVAPTQYIIQECTCGLDAARKEAKLP